MAKPFITVFLSDTLWFLVVFIWSLILFDHLSSLCGEMILGHLHYIDVGKNILWPFLYYTCGHLEAETDWFNLK